jgi:hypothetical protein
MMHFLQTVEAQWRLLAILTPIALRRLANPHPGPANLRDPCDRCGFPGRGPSRDPSAKTPVRNCDRQTIMARYCPPGRLPRPHVRWPSGMADLMEGMDTRHGRLRRRSSCSSFFFFLISVEEPSLKGCVAKNMRKRN